MELADSHVDLRRPKESPESAELLPVCEAGCPDSNNFGFAFDDINFSDRTLRIEIIPDDAKTDSEGFDGIPDLARYRKRKRSINGNDMIPHDEEQILNCHMPDSEESVPHENRDEDVVAMVEETPEGVGLNPSQIDMIPQDEEQILNCHVPDSEEFVPHENRDEEFVAMIEETPEGVGLNPSQIGRSTEGNDPSSSDPSIVLRVKTIHISSPILAAKSPFFYKLFSNGMRESEQRHVTLRIHESEEDAFMDLLNYMYSNKLPRTSPPALLEVLMAADKYEVSSCMNYCCRVLKNIPMTFESALLYLDLPSNVLMADAVQPLTLCAKQFLASRYKDFARFQDEVLNLPLAAIEPVFSSNDLQIGSEDAVYDFLLKWARLHYPEMEERKEILATRLIPLIRFPFMTCRKLKKVLTCTDFDSELVSKSVLEALFFKAEAPHRQRIISGDKSNPLHHRSIPRAYRYRPVKVMEFEQPRQQCLVYLDLTHDECKNLYPVGRVYSQAFNVFGQGFFLSAHCQMDHQNMFKCFGLFLGMQEKGSPNFVVDYEFATRSKSTIGYVSRYKGMYAFTGGKAVGYRNMLECPGKSLWLKTASISSMVFFILGSSLLSGHKPSSYSER